MSIVVKNTTQNDITIAGVVISGSGQYTVQASEQALWASNDDLVSKVGSGDLVINDGTNDLAPSDGLDHIKGFQQKLYFYDNRLKTAENRIPAGYSIYVAGEADDITNGNPGGGTKLLFDDINDEADFQLLTHYYIIGARAVWKNCDIDNYFDAQLYAPASTGFTNQTGDFDKVNLGTGMNLYKPVSAGTGAWDADLTAKQTNTNILKAVPVPAAGNNGWFDYDSDSNTLTTNMNQEGGYNLYDFDVPLHQFGRKVWGTNQNGGQTSLDVTGLVGKLIYNCWKIKLTFGLEGGLLGTNEAAVKIIIGAKGNV